MVRVRGGTVDATDPHGVVRRVSVSPFSLDRTEVTVREYWRCVSAGECRPHWSSLRGECNFVQLERRDHPMNCVGRQDAEAYCAWRGKRLPSLAEWQRAARGDADRPYPWGRVPPERVGDALTADRMCFETDGTCEVGSHPDGATPEGIHDLAGNVWELSERACVVLPPRPGMCGDYTSAVHGGGWSDCRPLDRACADTPFGRAVRTLEQVPPEAVGFRCAKSE